MTYIYMYMFNAPYSVNRLISYLFNLSVLTSLMAVVNLFTYLLSHLKVYMTILQIEMLFRYIDIDYRFLIDFRMGKHQGI